jgi:hypothetical protein
MLEYMCCWCSGPITDGMTAHTIITSDIVTGEFRQQWFSHQACFRERLHPNAQIYKSDDDEDEDWEPND